VASPLSADPYISRIVVSDRNEDLIEFHEATRIPHYIQVLARLRLEIGTSAPKTITTFQTFFSTPE
jgi:hypothetical protein